MNATMQWTAVCPADEIPAQGARVLRRPDGEDIAVFRNIEGHVFAVHDRCPHKGGPLSAGLVHGAAVTCPLHGMVIDLATGQAQAPDEGCVRTIPVKVENGYVCLALGEGA